jgi:hypothetical protein
LGEAITAYQNAAEILRDTGDRHLAEIALNDLNKTRQARAANPV